MIALLLACTPSLVHVFIRRLLGQAIGRGVRIRFGTVIRAKRLEIGDHTTIGPLVYISAGDVKLGKFTSIRGPTFISCTAVNLGNNVRISSLVIVRSDKRKNAKLSVGHCSSIFPCCWIEPGEGIQIGEHVSIGGFSLIFTHAVWTSYIDGGPLLRAPVVIGDRTYIPWKVFVLPGVTIGRDCVIGAGAVVNKSVPDQTLAAGVPARVLRSPAFDVTDMAEKRRRAEEILANFAADNGTQLHEGVVEVEGRKYRLSNGGGDLKIHSDDVTIDLIKCRVNDAGLSKASTLTNYLRDYGIRLNPEEK